MTIYVKSIAPEDTQSVRHRVLWPHRASVESCTIDIDAAEHARHLGAFSAGGSLLGVLSLFEQRSDRFPHAFDDSVPLYRLRAMGVLPEYRRMGVGESLVNEACGLARQLGAEWLWCDAREVAFAFYEALEFEYLSQPFEIPLIGPHRMMARAL